MELSLQLYTKHESGVLLTKQIIGQMLYSHSAACQGKLIVLTIDKIEGHQVFYHLEDGKSHVFIIADAKNGDRVWEAIDQATAYAEIANFLNVCSTAVDA